MMCKKKRLRKAKKLIDELRTDNARLRAWLDRLVENENASS